MRVCIQKLLPLLKDNGTDRSHYNSALMRKGLEVEIQQAMELLQVLRSDPVQLTSFDSQDDKEMAFRFIDSLKQVLERRTLPNRGENCSESDVNKTELS
jgi:hypothetical protein